MAIRNMSQLEKELKKVFYLGLSAEARKAEALIEEFIREYYKEYDPVVYKRTYKFLNSIVRTKPRTIDGGYEIETYIDTSIKYTSDWDMGDTAEQANKGIHGYEYAVAVGGGGHFWDDAMERTPDVVRNAFIEYLRKKSFKFTVI